MNKEKKSRRVDAQTEWRGQRDTTKKRLVAFLFVSLLLHAPLSPLVALLGLVGLMAPPEDEPPALPPITAIPVDLVPADGPASGAERPAEPETRAAPSQDIALREVEPERPKPKPKPKPPSPEPEETDAGVADAAVASADAQADAADAGPPGPGRSIGDPVAMSGAARVADANANVRLIVYTERVRNHPLGPRIGQLLGSAYQWRDFFGPTALDPIRDVDRILIAGPQLRDSSEVVAVLKHNVGEGQIRQAIDMLVKRDPNGGWHDAGVPAASARADRAERVFVIPATDLVIVSPPSAAENVKKQGPNVRFPAPRGPEVVTAYVVTPWRVFIGLPFRLPKTIKWAKLEVVPAPDGGAVAYLEAEDESEEAAATNAEQLERAARAATQVDLGILGSFLGAQRHKFIDDVTFRAKGPRIHGRATANGKQLASLVEMLSAYTRQLAERGTRRAAQAADGAPPAPATQRPDGG